MAEETTSIEPTTGGKKTQSRPQLYQKFEPLADRAIEKLQTLLESRNESIAMGAVKIILERTVPAIKAIEITGENGGPIKLNIISGADYVSSIGNAATASETSTTYGPAEVQSTDLAQASPEDNNSNQSISEVESA